jgi:hypothetical protein
MRILPIRRLLIVVASLLVIGIALPDDIGEFDISVEKAAVVARIHGVASPNSISTPPGIGVSVEKSPNVSQVSVTPRFSNTLICISACVLRC